MFDYRKISENAAAAVLAIVLSAVSVGAAVGPARAVETGPSLYASAPVALRPCLRRSTCPPTSWFGSRRGPAARAATKRPAAPRITRPGPASVSWRSCR